MTVLVLCAALAGVGAVLVLSERRWFRRAPLAHRLAPYLPGRAGPTRLGAGGVLATSRTLLTALAQSIGARVTPLLGVTEDLAIRLERIHAPEGPDTWRLRQLAHVLGALAVAAAIVGALAPPAPLALLLIGGLPVLAFLVQEHRVATASARWQRRLFLELPVVSEQLGMLLSAGYSVGAAIDRLARRGHGACATDLARVCSRIRHGLGEHAALDEWATTSDVPAVRRLVALLALDREASDLGRLITVESRTVRQEVHRELIETIERRSQQVWVPVTVATLVPGVLFLAVPFVAAMQLFTAS